MGVLLLPLLNALVLGVIFLSWVCHFSRVYLGDEHPDADRFLTCLSDYGRSSMWIVLVVLVVEAVIHPLARTIGIGTVNGLLTLLFDAIVLGSIAGGVLLYIRFQHNSQEMYIFGTGSLDWIYTAVMFLLPMVLVALIVFLAELVVHQVTCLLRRQWGASERR